MKIFITKNPTETQKLGAKLAAALQGGEILALSGELGAGKTTLVQGLAQGLGVKETVTSPTFILLDVHKLPKPRRQIKYFVHVDTYRLKNAAEALTLGITDYLGRPDTVAVIEWAEKLQSLLNKYKIKKIALKTISEKEREIVVTSNA